jgi:dihydroxy-acid dehydratase
MTPIAGRLGIKVDLQAFDKLGPDTPVLVNLKPSGEYYMEDLHKAGGLGPSLRELRPLLHLDVPTISGRTLGEEIDALPAPWNQDVITLIDKPLYSEGDMALLQGNLAPGGAIIKQSAASPELMPHTGRAVVFDSLEDMTQRIDSEDLEVSADDVLVLRNAGPEGAPGMPEARYIPIP